MITIEVRGIPAPQGSKTRLAHGAMVESGRKKVDPWRAAVRAEAQRVLDGTHSAYMDKAIPIAMSIDFRLPRPASAPKRVKLPAKRPDLDKLARSVLDALVEASAIGDDSQVTCLQLTKTYASDLAPVGALIEITMDIAED